jgi:hypothetical protein
MGRGTGDRVGSRDAERVESFRASPPGKRLLQLNKIQKSRFA